MIKVHASDYMKMKDLMQTILKFTICETDFFLLPTFWKNTRTCYIPSMKMVAMSSLHPLRWITRDNYWYFGYSTFTETRITWSTFYIVKLSFFAHFKGHFGFHFLLNIKELPNNNH